MLGRLIMAMAASAFTDEQIHESCKIDPWFLEQMRQIVDTEEKIRSFGLPQTPGAFRQIKAMGFSDKRLAAVTGKTEVEVRALRRSLDVRPVYKRIDTCAAEFASPTAYMYSTYETPFAGKAGGRGAIRPTSKKVVILGGGPNRIGQGIEFDYCCCHACFALRDAGYETIMINCNPETVSTDYDTSDRLYFEPLTAEDVLEIIDTEACARHAAWRHRAVRRADAAQARRCRWKKANVPILGTSPDMPSTSPRTATVSRSLIEKLQAASQPKTQGSPAFGRPGAQDRRRDSAFPVVIRPSYVLGGRAMEIVRDDGPHARPIISLGTLHEPDPLRGQGQISGRLDRVRSTRFWARTRC